MKKMMKQAQTKTKAKAKPMTKSRNQIGASMKPNGKAKRGMKRYG